MLPSHEIDMAQVQRLLNSTRYLIALAKTDRPTAHECIHSTHRAIRESFAALARSDHMMDKSSYFPWSR